VAFSRDGEWVAYVSYPDWVLWRSRVDGSERLQLTSRPMSAVVPRWSPDGRRVAAISRDSLALLLFDRETQRWEPVVEEAVRTEFSAWSRDGSHLYFLTTGDDGSSISRLRIADRKLERVADLGGFRLAMPWFGLDPEDSILLARDAGIQEIYALDFEAP
jgi:Tol biopolymer transport system component